MRRRESIVALAALALAGVAAGVFVSGGGASSNASQAVSRVSVAATDFKFALSRRSAPIGTVIFTVTNKGKKPHDFKIDGKKTSPLAPGHSATLRVTFSKQGRYPYLSTISGQAAAGMKGVFTVGSALITPTLQPHVHDRSDDRVDHGRYGQHDGQGRHVRRQRAAPLRALPDDDPVGHGHVRDRERVSFPTAASTSSASRRARSSPRAGRRRGRWRCTQGGTPTTATQTRCK